MELAMVTGRQTARRLIQKRSLPTRPALQDSPQLRLQIGGIEFMDMSHMLAYTIRPGTYSGMNPSLTIGFGRDATYMFPDNKQDDSYWICIFNAKNPRQKVKDWVVPGQNAAVPPGIDTYMNNPDYLFAVATQYLNTLHVPHGPFYDFLAKYGAGRELQKLEQLSAVLSCGSFGRMNYALTGQCGPRESGKPAPPSYEKSSYLDDPALLMMSLMPMKNGAPPYAICDSYTWTNPQAA
jgi:hypothetical protein